MLQKADLENMKDNLGKTTQNFFLKSKNSYLFFFVIIEIKLRIENRWFESKNGLEI